MGVAQSFAFKSSGRATPTSPGWSLCPSVITTGRYLNCVKPLNRPCPRPVRSRTQTEAKKPSLGERPATDHELNPGDRVEGFWAISENHNEELGTVERRNRRRRIQSNGMRTVIQNSNNPSHKKGLAKGRCETSQQPLARLPEVLDERYCSDSFWESCVALEMIPEGGISLWPRTLQIKTGDPSPHRLVQSRTPRGSQAW